MGAMGGEGGAGGSSASKGGKTRGGGGTTSDVAPPLAAGQASCSLASLCSLHKRSGLSVGHSLARLSWRAFSSRAYELTARYPANNPVFALSCATFTLPSTSGHAPASHS